MKRGQSIIKKLTAIITTALLLLLTALSGYASNIKHIIIFGDSLSYDGRLNDVLAYLHLPFNYTNGKSWSQILSKSFNDQHISHQNYTLPGGTARFQTADWITSLAFLNMEIANYLYHSSRKERSESLVIIWIGSNDYITYQQEITSQNYRSYVDNTILAISRAITKLIAHGCKNFLVMNLGDLSKTPYFIAQHRGTEISSLVSDHNRKLSVELENIKKKYGGNIYQFNIHHFFEKIIQHKTNFGLQNISEACKIGKMVCSQPGGYFYWDHLHFTKKIHLALAKAVREYINESWPDIAPSQLKGSTKGGQKN